MGEFVTPTFRYRVKEGLNKVLYLSIDTSNLSLLPLATLTTRVDGCIESNPIQVPLRTREIYFMVPKDRENVPVEATEAYVHIPNGPNDKWALSLFYFGLINSLNLPGLFSLPKEVTNNRRTVELIPNRGLVEKIINRMAILTTINFLQTPHPFAN